MNRSTQEPTNLQILFRAVRQAPPRIRGLCLVILFWSVGTLFATGIELVNFALDGDVQTLLRHLGGNIGVAGMVLLSITQILHVSTQQPDTWCHGWNFKLPWERMDQMLLALPVLAFVAGALMALGAGTQLMLLPHPRSLSGISSLLLFGGLTVYAGHMVGRTGRFLYRYAQEQADAASRAREEASEAQLQALQAQMNPHFLFNALNTVASLVNTDAREAEATVENLAQILRRTLDRSSRTLCSVSDEVDYLRAYLAIEQQRFGNRLRVEWMVEPGALELQIPPMSLQPLVENALKHAIGTRLEGGRLRIGAFLLDRKLVLEVEDDGDGFPETYQEGTGLSNLRERLSTLYGERASLQVEREPRGSRVLVELPALPGSGT